MKARVVNISYEFLMFPPLVQFFLSPPPKGAWFLGRIKQICSNIRLVLIAMSIRAVVGPILRCAFIVADEVAVEIWALAGCSGDLAKAPIATGQETSPAEVCRQIKRAVEPLGEHALGVGRLVVEEGAAARGEDRGDQVGKGAGVGRLLCKGSYHRSDHSALLALFAE